MKYFLALLLVILLCGCSEKKNDELTITTNLWVGFTPIIYARQKGMLKDCRIKLHIVSSLGESYRLYDSGLISGFTGTQAEAERVKSSDLVPVILIDTSYGADSVVSTMSEDELKTTKEKVTVYYEMNTVNEIMLSYLFRSGYLTDDRENIELKNMTQDQILSLDMHGQRTVVITYAPYTSQYLRNGMNEVINSKHEDILILDALFVKKEMIKPYKNDLKILRDAFIKALIVFNNDPDSFYDTIRDYLKGQSYDDFMESTKGIKWIVNEDNRRVLEQMRKADIETGELILD